MRSTPCRCPGSIKIVNGNGDCHGGVGLRRFEDQGTLLNGNDSFTVGGTLDVAAMQAAGKYTGSFTVAVEYQ